MSVSLLRDDDDDDDDAVAKPTGLPPLLSNRMNEQKTTRESKYLSPDDDKLGNITFNICLISLLLFLFFLLYSIFKK